MSDPSSTRRQVAEDLAGQTTSEHLEAVDPAGSDLPPLRDYNVFATFADAEAARDAIVALERRGIDGGDISALALERSDGSDDIDLRQPTEPSETVEHDSEVMAEHASQVAKGAGIGAVAGALGSTAIALAIPGVGAAVGAGILAVAAGGAVAGTGVGGFTGAVVSTPAAKGWQHAVADLDHGRVVVGVHSTAAHRHDEALGVLAGAGAISVRELDPDGRPL